MEAFVGGMGEGVSERTQQAGKREAAAAAAAAGEQGAAGRRLSRTTAGRTRRRKAGLPHYCCRCCRSPRSYRTGPGSCHPHPGWEERNRTLLGWSEHRNAQRPIEGITFTFSFKAFSRRFYAKGLVSDSHPTY